MMWLSLFVAALTPWVVLLLPGIVVAREEENGTGYVARALLWSISLWTLLSFLAGFLNLPPVYIVLTMGMLMVALGWQRSKFTWQQLQSSKLLLGFAASTYLFFGVAFWFNHAALPTGDSQKAIFWASQALERTGLPDYALAAPVLNRDPVDFYTPGLHLLTGTLMKFSPLPLATVGFFSIAAAIGVAVLAISLTGLLIPQGGRAFWYIAGILILTNTRFLRYLREPGYHYQNVVGELLLFGLVYVGISLLKKWSWWDVLLGVLTGITLLLSHQFSTFLAVFALLPIALLVLGHYLHSHVLQHLSPIKLTALATSVGLCLLAGFSLGLHHKLPDIFTLTPHLRHLVVPWYEYPRTLGFLLVYLGLGGFVLLLRRRRDLPTLAFVLSAAMLLLLSYGPWLMIDIPPVRALFYSIVPLACLASVFLYYLFGKKSVVQTIPALCLLLVLLLGSSYQTVRAALVTQHAVRTNSTLQAAQISLIDFLAGSADTRAVLTDDYNRRSSSWLLLAGHPTYTRLAADIRTQMAEATQSGARNELYLHHLDYEKIYSLGSFPEITHLLQKYNIGYVTGVTGSTRAALAANPALATAAQSGDLTLFAAPFEGIKTPLTDMATWLLRPSTLANDIGDDEDTFEHLPASLRTTRLSDPEVVGPTTYRTTSSPITALRFNVRDYVRVLWAKEGREVSDIALEFFWQAEGEVPGLRLRTITGKSLSLPAHAMIRLESAEVPFDADGFITLFIDNPQEREVMIDAFALGLARVP